MKKITTFILSIFFLMSIFSFSACDTNDIDETITEAETTPSSSSFSTISNITSITDDFTENTISTTIPENAIAITNAIEITEDGSYVLSGTIYVGTNQIKVDKDLTNVVLYFNGITINKVEDKKVINAKSNTTIVLVADTTNTITTTFDDSDAIGGDENLTIIGSGSLNVTGTDDAISVDGTLTILGGTITATANLGHSLVAENIIINNAEIITNTIDKDGIHSETDYDDETTEPVFAFTTGFVYIENSNITIVTTGEGDGIQADSFVQIVSGDIDITTNSGAPSTITETSSNNANGKAIKAGLIDWGEADSELESENYTIYIQGGTFNINSNDDAIHSNGFLLIEGGTFNLATGDDAIHSDNLLKITSGDITISTCYEGIESAKVEIVNGNIDITCSDDGINAAEGTAEDTQDYNDNCYVIISGGNIEIEASGYADGIDSNGTLLISGGTLYVNGTTEIEDNSLDSNGGIIINGGTVVAVGSLGIIETPTTTSTQYCISYVTEDVIAAGTNIYLKDSSNNILCELTTTKASNFIIISDSDIVLNSTYSIVADTTILETFTIDSIVTNLGTYESQEPPMMPPMR